MSAGAPKRTPPSGRSPRDQEAAALQRQLAALGRLQANFMAYAPQCLKIKTKKGEIVPLRPNRAQLHIHEQLELQKQRTGMVRALILKGRQQGASTYIGARFYHKASLNAGVGVYILTHEQPATDNLFNMVARFHAHSPLKPSTGKANAKELAFDKLDSGYTVATAGTKAAGRSRTVQLFHGSEVAFWENDTDHFAASVQTVPDEPGTEIILESTANGVTGEFNERWQDAEAGVGDYIAIFVPWFWELGYSRLVPDDFILSTERPSDGLSEEEYYRLHGLTLGQMVWRRAKIHELGPILFMQEYPATAQEAFQTTGHDSFIKPAAVLRARKHHIDDEAVLGPLILGIDPSRFGDDLFAIARRRSRKVFGVETKEKVNSVDAANWIKQVIDDEKPVKAFIDVGGIGGPVYDMVQSFGAKYDKILVPVDFGATALQETIILPNGERGPGPKNRRAEMWYNSREWLNTAGGVDIPDEGVLQTEACAPGYKYDNNQNIVLESKQQMRKRKVRSPDRWDAIALTFAEPVYDKKDVADSGRRRYTGDGVDFAVPGGWMSL